MPVYSETEEIPAPDNLLSVDFRKSNYSALRQKMEKLRGIMQKESD